MAEIMVLEGLGDDIGNLDFDVGIGRFNIEVDEADSAVLDTVAPESLSQITIGTGTVVSTVATVGLLGVAAFGIWLLVKELGGLIK